MNEIRSSTFLNWKQLAGAVAVAVVSGVIGATAVLAVDPTGCDVSTAWPEAGLLTSALERAAAKAVPSVVKLEEGTDRLSNAASGIVLSSDGLILTDSHVASAFGNLPGVDSAKPSAIFADGRTARFSLVGSDPATDVAVPRAEGVSGLIPITVGSAANLHVGQKVVAVGSPLGLQGTVSAGIISALHRPVPTVGDSTNPQTVLDAIQTDAAINPGSFGGALIDSNGDLIGVTSLLATIGNLMFGPSGSIGLGFAIPVDQAKRIATELIATGKASHAYLGVQLADDNGTRGAKIVETQLRSPAAAAGLNPGAVITKMDDRLITSRDALVAAVLSRTPGDTVSVTFTDTASATQTARVTLASDRDWQ
jgi:putative serine protease PepD